MADYTAEQGFALLEYLGLPEITRMEREAFRKDWNVFYRSSGNFVAAVKALYTKALPLRLSNDQDLLSEMRVYREDWFEYNSKVMRLEEKLAQGVSIEEILKQKPSKYVRMLSEDDLYNN